MLRVVFIVDVVFQSAVTTDSKRFLSAFFFFVIVFLAVETLYDVYFFCPCFYIDFSAQDVVSVVCKHFIASFT
jgi:hypothetical protein